MGRARSFTDTWLRSLKSKLKRYEVTALGRRGLLVRVFPSGQKSFQYRYIYGGRVRRLTLGPYPQISLAEAYDAHAEAIKLLRAGQDPLYTALPAAGLSGQSDTVADLAEEFMQRYVLVRRKRPQAVDQLLRANVLPAWGPRPARDGEPGMADKFLNARGW